MWWAASFFLLVAVVGLVVRSAYDDWRQVEEMHHV